MQTKTKIRILWGIAIIILSFMVYVSTAHSATVLQPFQGGTGKGSATAGNVGDCLTVLDDSPFSYAFAECASGAGDAMTTDPLSQFAATTSLQLKDTISDETGSGALVFANSPVFTTPNIGSATGSISGNAGTATALFANGSNCSSGSSPLGIDASGAVESCFDVWTEAENTSAGYTTLAAVAGVGYFDGLDDFTGTLTDTKYCTYDLAGGEIDCNSEAGSSFDSTALDALTWSDGANASNVWTFDNSGTDTTMTFASGLVTFSHGVTVSGALTGTLTGNASTATALAANPADCSSNQFANAIAASGALTCGAIGDADVPNNITIDLASSASDLTCTDCINATEIEDIYLLNSGDTSTGLLVASANFDISNGATSSGILKILEDTDDGSNYATFQVPALAANTVYILPSDDGESGEVLSTNGTGTLTWEAVASGTPTAITVADGGGDTTMNVGLFTDATGDLGPKTDTGLTFNGTTDTLTATTFVGALTGNASTASALAADPADCAANQFAQSIVAAGTLTCAAIADSDVPNNITIDLATLASTVTVVDGTDSTSFIGIYDSATGSLAPKTDGALLYAADTGSMSTNIITANTRFAADADDGAALGASGTAFSDLFLASGGIINWNAGNATLTHSAGLLTSNVDIVVPTEVYGVGWNGSNEVPTKDALYDKIETLGGTPFFHQRIPGPIQAGTRMRASGSNTTGSVLYVVHNFASTELWRYERDASGSYYMTHTVNMTTPIPSNDSGSIVELGDYIYVFRNNGTNIMVTRYDKLTLANETEMTEPSVGNTDFITAWTDGTKVYMVTDLGTSGRSWTVSGTTFTASTTFTTATAAMAGENAASMYDGTTVYIARMLASTSIVIYKCTAIDCSTSSNTTKLFTSSPISDADQGVFIIPIDSTRLYIGLTSVNYDEAAAVSSTINLMPVAKP